MIDPKDFAAALNKHYTLFKTMHNTLLMLVRKVNPELNSWYDYNSNNIGTKSDSFHCHYCHQDVAGNSTFSHGYQHFKELKEKFGTFL